MCFFAIGAHEIVIYEIHRVDLTEREPSFGYVTVVLARIFLSSSKDGDVRTVIDRGPVLDTCRYPSRLAQVYDPVKFFEIFEICNVIEIDLVIRVFIGNERKEERKRRKLALSIGKNEKVSPFLLKTTWPRRVERCLVHGLSRYRIDARHRKKPIAEANAS